MQLVSEETLKQVLVGGESVAKVAAGITTELVNEALNFYILEGVLSILKFAAVFVIFYIVKRYADSIADDKNVKFVKMFKTTAMVVSLTFFTYKSYPHLVSISKAMVAPKLFLLEKSKEFVSK